MIAPALLLALAAAPWSAQTEAQRAASLEKLRALPLEARLVEISAGFLGTPYQFSPLGEGLGKDPDPLMRFDKADCLSMVEQTVAMALAPSDDQVLPLLNTIRYADQVSYASRNHLMEAQWLPNNVKKGFLVDVTRTLAKDAARKVVKTVDARAWNGKEGQGLGLAEADQIHGEFPLELVPAARAEEVLARAPSGTVVAVLRKDRPDHVTRVSHVGFVVQKGGVTHLRHASRSFGKAVDEPLSKYLARNLGFGQWTVEGFSLFAVRPPPAK